MSGYYVRLAKANNDEFINVKRRVVVVGGGGWGRRRRQPACTCEAQQQYFLLITAKGDIKNRKRRETRAQVKEFLCKTKQF